MSAPLPPQSHLQAELERHRVRLAGARRHAEVFGAFVAADEAGRLAELAAAFRKIVAEVHPDRFVHNAQLADLATEVMTLLNGWRDEAERQIRLQSARQTTGSAHFFEVRGKRYAILRDLPAGDIADVFVVQDEQDVAAEPLVLKVAKDPANNDLLDNECAVLQRLWAAPQAQVEVFGRYLPRVVRSTTLPDDKRATLLTFAEGYLPLAEVQRAYPLGVDGRSLAWMGNRLFELLAWVHGQGVVHGAVLPEHVLIHPVTHGALLVDWCYAVADWQWPGGPHLAAVPKSAKKRYPDEVFQRVAASPRLDLFLAAGTLGQLAGIDLWTMQAPTDLGRPDAAPIASGMVEVLRGCRLARPADRFADSFDVWERWKQAQRRAFGPRKFVPFAMPATSAIS